MGEDIEQLAEEIMHEEPAHAPRLAGRAVPYRELGPSYLGWFCH